MSRQYLGRKISQRPREDRVRRDRIRESEVRNSKLAEPRGVRERAAAKIGHLDLPAQRVPVASLAVAFPAGGDQNIGRLQILVQNSNVVRRRNRLRDLNQHAQTQLARNPRQPTLVLRPLGKVRATVLALNKERLRVEIPLQHPDKILPLAQRFAQKPRQRHFALQSFQLRPVGCKLKHPRFMSLGVFPQPNFARA